MNTKNRLNDNSACGFPARFWFSLTGRERKWLLLVLALLILGMAVRHRHLSRERVETHLGSQPVEKMTGD